MIVLDTNIVSELMKQSPSLSVLNWMDEQDSATLFLTSITIAEISYGIDVLSEGMRKSDLYRAFNKMLKEAFKDRVLFFDDLAAQQYGFIMAHRKKAGKPLSVFDGQIAAITVQQSASLATRNIKDFANCGLELINPFDF